MERLGPRLKRARSNFSISSGALLVLLVFLFYLDRMPTQGHGEWPFPEAGLSSILLPIPSFVAFGVPTTGGPRTQLK
jgi:hypothetical protein